MIGMRFKVTIIWNAREYKKSPTRTLVALPNTSLAVSRPRRSEDDVVVQQRCGMDEFDDGGAFDVARPAVPAGASRKQQHEGSQAFAARMNDIGGNLVDEGNLTVQAILDDPVDGLKICCNQLANLFYCHEALKPILHGT